MESDLYMYKKEIDWSTLHLGLNIPVSRQDIFYESIKIRLKKGESKRVKLAIDNNQYVVVLTNILFDANKYPNHKELLQIRYTSPNSDVAKMMRTIFHKSYDYLRLKRIQQENKRRSISVPENQREYIAIYATSIDDVFCVECITNDEIVQARQSFEGYTELELEQLINTTDTAAIVSKPGIVKIRKMDKSIGDTLKTVYDFRCQICGEFIGKLYDATVIHVHHIEYFSISFNNDVANIVVVCPNHHGIIHAANPIFDKKNKVFIYHNGYIEGLKLNLHL